MVQVIFLANVLGTVVPLMEPVLPLPLRDMVREVGDMVRLLAVTVILQVAVFLVPSALVTVAVISAVPAFRPLTKPLELTDATVGALLSQVTALVVALLGATVAVSWSVSFTPILAVAWFKVTPVAGILEAVTVILQVAVQVTPLTTTDKLMVASPGATPFTFPVESMVALSVFLLDQVMLDAEAPLLFERV